ncbi:MAG: caspase family protein, partial [Abditibacteriales bacterium]|nr:caspase family protein [Abditibacteriales bacterium]MDW8365821.1 caspase family protein [Abditibacteriales bacterium]
MLQFRCSPTGWLLVLIALCLSVEAPAPTSAQTKGRGCALLIGIDDYRNVKVEGFKSLRTCVNDVLRLGKVLKEQGIYDERIYRVIKNQPDSLLDDPRDLTTPLFNDDRPVILDAGKEKSIITDQIDKVLDATSQWTSDDFVLVYLSCHGLYKNKELYFLLPNADLNDPDTFITFREIALHFRRCPATVVFIFDACNAAGYAPQGSFDAKEAKRQYRDERYKASLQAKGFLRVVIPSCSDAKESSYELADEKSGLFTYCLIKALKGEAGGPDITLGNVIKYLVDNVGKVARARGLNQTLSPDVIYDGGEGISNVLVLAKTKHSPVMTLLQDRLTREFEQSGGAALNAQKIPIDQDLTDAQRIMRRHLLKFAQETVQRERWDLSEGQIAEAVAQICPLPEKSPPLERWAAARFASPPGEQPLDVEERCDKWFNELRSYLRGEGQPSYEFYAKRLREAGVPPVLRYLVVKDNKGYGATLETGAVIECAEETLTFHIAASLVSDKFRLFQREEGQRRAVEFRGVTRDTQDLLKIARHAAGTGSKGQGAGVPAELTGREFQIRRDDLQKKSNVMELFIEDEAAGGKIYSPPFTLTVTCPANLTLSASVPKETTQTQLRLTGKVWDKEGRPRVIVQVGEKRDAAKVDEQPDADGLFGWTAEVSLQKGVNALRIEALKSRGDDLLRPPLIYTIELKEKLLPVVIEEFKEKVPDGITVRVNEKPFQKSLAEAVVNPNGSAHIEVLKDGVKVLEGVFSSDERGIRKRLSDLTPVTWAVEFDTSKITDKSLLKDLRLQPQRVWLADVKEYEGKVAVPSPLFERMQEPVRLPVGDYRIELKGKDSDIWYAVADGQTTFSVTEGKKVSVELRRYADGALKVTTQPVGRKFALKPTDREGEPRVVTEHEREVKDIPAGYYSIEGTPDSKYINLKRFLEVNKTLIAEGRLQVVAENGQLKALKVPSASQRPTPPEIVVPFGVPKPFFPVPPRDHVNVAVDGDRLLLDEENQSGRVIVRRRVNQKDLVYWQGELKNGTLTDIEQGFARVAAQWTVALPPQTAVWLEPTEEVPYFNVYKDRKPQTVPAEVKARVVEWKEKIPVGFYTLKVQLPGLLHPIPIETVALEATPDALHSLTVPLLARLGEAENLKKVKAAIPVCETVKVKATRKGNPLDEGAVVQLVPSPRAEPLAVQTFAALKQGQPGESAQWMDDLLSEFRKPQTGQTVQKGIATFQRVWAGQYEVMLQLKGKPKPRLARLSNKQKATALTVPAQQGTFNLDVLFPQTLVVFKSTKPEIGLRGLALVPKDGGEPIPLEGEKEASTEDMDSDVVYRLEWKKSHAAPRWKPTPQEIKISDDKEQESFEVNFERNRAKVTFRLDVPSKLENVPPCVLRPKPTPDDVGWRAKDVKVPSDGQPMEIEVGRYEVSEGWELVGEKPTDNVGRIEVDKDQTIRVRRQIYASSVKSKRPLPPWGAVTVETKQGRKPLLDKEGRLSKDLIEDGDYLLILRREDHPDGVPKEGKVLIRHRGDDVVAAVMLDDKGTEVELDRIVDMVWRLPTPRTQPLRFPNSPDIKSVEVSLTYIKTDPDGTRRTETTRLKLKRQEPGDEFIVDGRLEESWKTICPRLKDFDPKHPRPELSPFFVNPNNEKECVL